MNIYKSKTEKKGRQTMQTPPGIAEFCAATWGCNIDLAATIDNRKFKLFFSDVQHFRADGVTPYEDCLGNALTERWLRDEHYKPVGFCNPPYADLKPWLTKANEEAVGGFTSVFLIPTFNGDEWARLAYIWAREIIFIEGRINFILESTGLPLSGNGRGSMLCVFGPRCAIQPSFSYVRREIME